MWPPLLRQLTFGHKSNQTIDDFLWPESFEKLLRSYGDCFEQSLDNAKRPVSLVILILRGESNSVYGVKWPMSLVHPFLGSSFNSPI